MQDQLDQITRLVLSELGEDDGRSVNLTFSFPKAIRSACKQYLMYFAQFLSDLGIEATAQIREKAQEVLFSVSPTYKDQALEQVREALEMYLGLPLVSHLATEAAAFRDVAVLQLQANVSHLQSQFLLAQAAIEMKNATIEAKDAQISYLRLEIDFGSFLPKGSVQVQGSGDEDLITDLISVKPFEYKFLRLNVPEMLRRLERKFR